MEELVRWLPKPPKVAELRERPNKPPTELPKPVRVEDRDDLVNEEVDREAAR